MGLTPLAWRALAARPLRSVLTILGVALGVAVLGASLTLGAGLDAAVNRTVRDVVGVADLRVSAFLERGLAPATVDAIAATEGVSVAAASIERRVFPSPAAGHAPADPVTVLGVDPGSYATLHPLELVAGDILARRDETSVIVTESLATSDGYALGSEVTLQGRDEPVHLRVVGILAGPGPVAGTAGRTMLVPIDTLQAIYGPLGVTRVDVALADGASATDVAARFAARITDDPYVLASPADIASGLRASTADFQATMALVATIVLFVGAFLIINTLSMTVGERAREVGLLRVAGATRGQIVRFVLAGALILGVTGSVLGIGLGAILGNLMAASVRSLTGFSADLGGLSVTSLVLALGVGLAITVAAAIEPGMRIAWIPPMEALRARLDLPRVRRGRLSWVAGILVLVGLLALLVWPPAAGLTGADRAIAVYAALLGATLLTPFLLPAVGRVVGAPIAAAVRLEERLARGSLARDRSRAALSVGALVVGLAMVVALGWTAQAARERATAWLADVVPGDEVVTSIVPVEPDGFVADELAAVPGVRRVTPIATFDLAIAGVRVDAAAVRGADLLADGSLTFTAGDRAAALAALDAGGAAIVPAATAARLGVGVGDRVTVATGVGDPLALRVVGIVERSIPTSGGEAMLIGWGDATGAVGVQGADLFAVRFAPGASVADREALRTVARTYALEANPLSRIQGAVTDALGRVFGLFDALTLIAVLVAGLGIVNTLVMGVVERVREIGVLRAIGMRRGQVARMVVVEATVLGAVGVVLGGATGLGIGAILLLLTGGFTPGLGVPWSSLAVAAVLGIALSVAAAYYPARLAARISIVRAVGFE